jgi:hypothetical protein
VLCAVDIQRSLDADFDIVQRPVVLAAWYYREVALAVFGFLIEEQPEEGVLNGCLAGSVRPADDGVLAAWIKDEGRTDALEVFDSRMIRSLKWCFI